MDYILLSALAPLLIASVFISYDIACQFKLKFEERMVKLPSEIQLPPSVNCDWGIPKCHCPMHKVSYQAPHSLNLKTGVGRTDCEGIERSWSELNCMANSTKEMGPGSCHNTLDDHIGHHNFRKYVGLGESNFLTVAGLKQTSFRTISPFTTCPCDGGAKVAEANLWWLHGIAHAWGWEMLDDQDIGVGKGLGETEPLCCHCDPCVPVLCSSQGHPPNFLLRCFSGRSKQAAPSRGNCHSKGRHPSATCHGSHGIYFTRVVGRRKPVSIVELVCGSHNWQVSRRRICWDARHPNQLTASQDNEIQCRSLLLLRQLKHFCNLQVVYMPAASLMLLQEEEGHQEAESSEAETDDMHPSKDVEHEPLWLPCALPENHLTHNCDKNLITIESRLHWAQCEDTLDKICSLQRGHLSFISFCNHNIQHQNPNTWAQDTLNCLEDKSNALAVKYRMACAALLKLMGPGDWENQPRELNHGDLTTPDRHEISIKNPDDPFRADGWELSKKKQANIEKGLGQGKKVVSWIWTTAQSIVGGSNAVLHEGKSFALTCDQSAEEPSSTAVMVEWVKVCARHLWWWEEVHLLKEEMRCVQQSLEWKTLWWEEWQLGWEGLDDAGRDGVQAYVVRQANMQCALHARFSHLWDKPLMPLISQDDSGEVPSYIVDPVLEAGGGWQCIENLSTFACVGDLGWEDGWRICMCWSVVANSSTSSKCNLFNPSSCDIFAAEALVYDQPTLHSCTLSFFVRGAFL